jgi:hypothetical protein
MAFDASLITIEKTDATGEFASGWASVVSVDGVPVEDWQGHIIEIETIRKSARAFITDARVAKLMHKKQQIGEIVESVIIDDEFAKAHGVTHGKRGWWITMKIMDEDVRKRVRSGELRAFSIGGKGRLTDA